ncbi:MAG TPA: hypothetical protein VFZ61_17565, partial [Polyangiales bacterium]
MRGPSGSRLAIGLLMLAACPGAGPEDEGAGAASVARGPLVGRVDASPIGLDEVRELCAATGLAPLDALRRLEDERLLTRAAAVRGYDKNGVVLAEVKRAEVQ